MNTKKTMLILSTFLINNCIGQFTLEDINFDLLPQDKVPKYISTINIKY